MHIIDAKQMFLVLENIAINMTYKSLSFLSGGGHTKQARKYYANSTMKTKWTDKIETHGRVWCRGDLKS